MSSASRQVPSDGVSLQNWSLRDEPLRVALVFFGSSVLAIAAGIISHSVAMGCLVLAACAISQWRVWIPVTYEIDSFGITYTLLRRRRRISWREIARVEIRRAGVLLLPESDRSPAVALRGLYIRWNDQGEPFIAALHKFSNRRSAGGSSLLRGGSTLH